MGVLFILGASMTVTGISALEMYRLRRRHGIRLGAHPPTLPPPSTYTSNGYLSPQGNPYAPRPGHPGYTYPYAPGPQNPYNRQNPYGR